MRNLNNGLVLKVSLIIGIKRYPIQVLSTFRTQQSCCISTQISGAGETVSLSYNEYVDTSSSNVPIRSQDHPILMTHGLLGSKQNWNSIAKAVTKSTSRKVITFDARNHGDSPHVKEHSYKDMCDDILRLVDNLQIDKFSLLGHSMGGRTAMTFALLYPSRIEKLIIVDVSPLSMSGVFGQMKIYLDSLMAINLDARLSLSEGRKIANEILKATTGDQNLRAFLLTNLAKTDEKGFYWKPNLPALLANLHELKDFPKQLLSCKLNGPVLFIRGGNSHYIPLSDYEGIQAIFPKAEFATISNSGHWPQADNPNQFIPTLVSFLVNS